MAEIFIDQKKKKKVTLDDEIRKISTGLRYDYYKQNVCYIINTLEIVINLLKWILVNKKN